MAQFVPLFENVEYPQPNTSGGTTESKLVSELSVRLIEYYENQPTRCIRLLNKLLNIYKLVPTILTQYPLATSEAIKRPVCVSWSLTVTRSDRPNLMMSPVMI